MKIVIFVYVTILSYSHISVAQAFVIDISIECQSQIEILTYKFGPAEEFCIPHKL